MKKDARNALLGKLSAPYGTGIDRTVAENVRLGGLMSACTDSEKLPHQVFIVNCNTQVIFYAICCPEFLHSPGLSDRVENNRRTDKGAYGNDFPPNSKADLFGDVPALAVLMLRVAGRIPDIGKTLNLMHIPVLLCGWSRSRC